MSQTYSTRQQELSGGRLFSSRVRTLTPGAARPGLPVMATATAIAPPPSVTVPVPVPAPAPAPASAPLPEPQHRYQFALTREGLATQAARTASAATGSVTLTGRPGGPYTVVAALSGLPPLKDPAMKPTLWLICDLAVPNDLAPADLVALPAGNQPGAVFTTDGNPVTYGTNGNTLAVAISPGVLTPAAGGTWQLTGTIDVTTNQAYHPFAVLGPAALADINVGLPSGTVARILTDVFMRPATVHPELSPRSQFPQRLQAVAGEVLTQPGAVSFLDGAQFRRAAVTLEGVVRGTPRLMPTREACLLVADSRVQEP